MMKNPGENTDGGLAVQSRPVMYRTNSPMDPSVNLSGLNISNNQGNMIGSMGSGQSGVQGNKSNQSGIQG